MPNKKSSFAPFNNFSSVILQSHVGLTCGIQPLKNYDRKTSFFWVLWTFLQQVEYCFSLWDPFCTLQRDIIESQDELGRTGPLKTIHSNPMQRTGPSYIDLVS